MLAGQLALILAAAFAERPFTSISLSIRRVSRWMTNCLSNGSQAMTPGYTMQASLAAISAALGLLAAWITGDWRWIVGAVLIFANWPYTLFRIMPTNNRLKAIAETDAGPTSRAMRVSWGQLHVIRTVLGFAATFAYLWALN